MKPLFGLITRLWCPVPDGATTGGLVGGAARTVAGLDTVDEATDRARPVCEAGADSGDSRGCVVFPSVSSSGDLIANGLLIELPNSPGMVKVGQPKSGLGTSGRWSMLVAKKWSDSGRQWQAE